MLTVRPYEAPEPRPFEEWCIALGLEARPLQDRTNQRLSFDDFCYYPNVKLYRVRDTELYGFWRTYGDVWGECRTVQEWLKDFEWELIEPTPEDLTDMSLFLGHDEFWEWSSGKIEYKTTSLWDDFKALIIKGRRNPSQT